MPLDTCGSSRRMAGACSAVSLRDLDISEVSHSIRWRVRLLEACSPVLLVASVWTGAAACVAMATLVDDPLLTGSVALGIMAGAFACWKLIEALLLDAIRRILFTRMAVRIGLLVSSDRARKSLLRSWSMPRPGVMSLADDGCLLLNDYSTGYALRHIGPGRISAMGILVLEAGGRLRREVDGAADLLTRTQQRSRLGRFCIGRTPEQGCIFLEIEYRLEHDADARHAIVPFGPGRRTAESFLRSIGRPASYL